MKFLNLRDGVRYYSNLRSYAKFLKKVAVPFILVLLLGSFENSFAKIINARSGALSVLQKALYSASIGDTVLIPAGDISFERSLTIPGGLTLMGSGQEATIIRMNSGSSTELLKVKSTNGEPVRITNLTIIGSQSSEAAGIVVGSYHEPTIDFRVDHVTLKNLGGIGIDVRGDARGVIDHCTFIEIGTYSIFVGGDGDDSWSRPFDPGKPDAVFVEDNLFVNGYWHHIASTNGSRYVFRYNTIDDDLDSIGQTTCCQAIDAHGKYNNGSWPRGSRSYEIYNNNVSGFGRTAWVVAIRGGDGVIFNNSFEGNYKYTIAIMNEHANGGESDNCNYPCKDQIRDLYIWNNTSNNKEADIHNRHPKIIQQGRDYFLKQKPGYTPYVYPHPLVSGDPLPIQIFTATLPQTLVGTPYSVQLRAQGGQKPYTWKIINGTLPEGIELKEDVLVGTTSANEGSYSFTIQVTDSKGSNATKDLSMDVFSGNFSSIPNFGDAKNWEPNNQNYWAVAEKDGDKRYIITTSQLGSSGSKLAAYSLVRDRTYKDFTMSLKVKSPENLEQNNGADFAVVFGFQNDDNYYYFMFNSNPAWSALHKVVNGTRSDIAFLNTALITDNDYHQIVISRKNTNILIKQNESTILNVSDATFVDGRIGIGSMNDAAYFDDIDIKSSAVTDNSPPNAPQNLQVKQEE